MPALPGWPANVEAATSNGPSSPNLDQRGQSTPVTVGTVPALAEASARASAGSTRRRHCTRATGCIRCTRRDRCPRDTHGACRTGPARFRPCTRCLHRVGDAQSTRRTRAATARRIATARRDPCTAACGCGDTRANRRVDGRGRPAARNDRPGCSGGRNRRGGTTGPQQCRPRDTHDRAATVLGLACNGQRRAHAARQRTAVRSPPGAPRSIRRHSRRHWPARSPGWCTTASSTLV